MAIEEIYLSGPDELEPSLLDSAQPVVLRGLVKTWDIVQGGRSGAREALKTLLTFYQGKPVATFLAEAGHEGRFFYNDAMDGFNFLQIDARLDDVIDKLLNCETQPDSPALYVGSTNIDQWLPGFRAKYDLPLTYLDPIASVWIGNQTRVAAHFDLPQNIACCVAGRRKFRLFAPDQISNLYVGPLDLTPAGQPISLVDFEAIDYARFPRAAEALRASETVVLEPGDAILIPSMWWHQVDALEPLNILVNYWWSRTPAYAGSPNDALLHALLSVRDLPPDMKRAWKLFFDYYIFNEDQAATQHIAPEALGRLGAPNETKAKRIRAMLLNQLKR